MEWCVGQSVVAAGEVQDGCVAADDAVWDRSVVGCGAWVWFMVIGGRRWHYGVGFWQVGRAGWVCGRWWWQVAVAWVDL